MNSRCCCQSMRVDSLPSSRGSRIRERLGIVVPSTILVLLPKCPLCLAAHVALGTGVSMSYSSASLVMRTLTVLSIGMIACCVIKRVFRHRLSPHISTNEVRP